MGQFSVTIYGATGSVLSDIQQSWDNPSYPAELEGDFHALMEEFYTTADHGEDDGDEVFPEVMTATGYLDFTEFAHMLWSNPRVVWAMTLPVFDVAPTLAKDVAFVRFQALNFTRYWTRMCVFVLFLMGFVLLAFPTLRVFALLTYGVTFGWE